jgi:hypothetical protein
MVGPVFESVIFGMKGAKVRNALKRRVRKKKGTHGAHQVRTSPTDCGLRNADRRLKGKKQTG